MEIPKEFVKKMKNLLDDEYTDYENSFKEKRVYGLRVNTLKIGSKELIDKNIFSIENIDWCKEGFYYKEEERPAKHPYYHAGLYYLQEPSAMSSGEVLPISEGDKVLDICAAPGGKTTQLGARLKNTGLIVANDISPSRAKAIVKNIELFGLKNCFVTSETPKRLSDKFPGYFDKILVDAPCSGEGMFRKDPDIAKSWNNEMIEFCKVEQKDILCNAARMLASGGMLLYSTCTFSPEENEKTINDFLNSNEDFNLVPIDKNLGFQDGCPEWVDGGRDELIYTKRLWPHKIKGEGHFLALLVKGKEEKYEFEYNKDKKIDKDFELFNEFKKETLNLELNGTLEIINNYLYLLPEGVPSFNGLRVIRSGWLLGEFKKNRFEPSQAMAMGLRKEEAKKFVELSFDNVGRYLKGETLEADVKDGWILVLYDGYPLGWAKAQSGRLKNKYPNGWILN